MKRHLQCAEQQSTPSNFTKYCDLPRKMNLMIGSTSHMKRHLHCPEQQSTPSNLTKYCACHYKMTTPTSDTNYLKTAETSFPMRDRSDHDPSMMHDPTMKIANRNPQRHRGYFAHSPRADSIENYNVSRSGYHANYSPNAAPATKSDT